ncbi:MAG: hypothetical protein EOO91_12815, partial [Pedobacter sp.]
MFIYPRKTAVGIICLALLFVLACKKDKPEEIPLVKKGMQISTDAKFGAVLTDSVGRTLYFFSSDVAGTANCTGACETTWPVYYSSNASTDLNVNAAEVAVITRADGKKQST